MMSQTGRKNRLVQGVCGFSAATSCDDVTESPAGNLFGWLQMSELGTFYFAGGFLTLAFAQFSPEAGAVICFLIILNFLDLPYTFFSVYYLKYIRFIILHLVLSNTCRAYFKHFSCKLLISIDISLYVCFTDSYSRISAGRESCDAPPVFFTDKI